MNEYSVLMTVYKSDNPLFIREAIDSMLHQTIRTNDFVIVCDGLLTNEIDNLLDGYSKDYKDIINLIRLKENVGLGAALQQGVLLCKNELIARMDDDDISMPDRCEKEMDVLKNSDLSIVGSYVKEFYNNQYEEGRIKKVPARYDEIIKFSRRRNPFNHSTVMFRKNDLIQAGNYSNMRTNQDVELWVRMLNNGYKGENITEPLVNFRFNRDTYSRRKEIKNIKLMIELWRDFWKKKYCSFVDYLYVLSTQLFIAIAPVKVTELLYELIRKL